MSEREILMEIRPFGAILRVAAVDAATGTEIVFQAPASTPHADLQRLAARKMAYVLAKRQNEKSR